MAIANTTIRIKKSVVTGNTPSSLANGEIAINSADGKLFYATPTGSISYLTNQQSFATINANSSLLLATSPTDTLTLIPGNNITIVANTSTKSITIGSTSSGGASIGSRTVAEITATAGQTTFAATYVPGYAEVLRNGIQLGSADFTATDGANVILGIGANAGDLIVIRSYFTNFISNNTFSSAITIANTTASTSTTTGALVVQGGVGIGGNVYIGSSGTAGSSALNFTANYPKITSPTYLEINNGLYVSSGTAYIQGTLAARGTIINDTGTYQVSVGSGSQLVVANTTTSTLYNTGSLIVSGGVGIAGRTTVNDIINRITGSGNSAWLQQDGSGRVHWYWNTYGGTTPTFTNAGEDAAATSMTVTNNGSGGAFFTRSASGVGKLAGDAISWTTVLYADLSSFSWKGNAVLRADNYNSYSPTLTGTGASGTWGISISGNAATATSATSASDSSALSGVALTNIPSGNNGTATSDAVSDMNSTTAKSGFYLYNNPANAPTATWQTWLNVSGHYSGDRYGWQLSHGYWDNDLWVRGVNSNSWRLWRKILDSNNYNSYAPTLTGTGASGTWGISVTGSAGSATTATTATTANALNTSNNYQVNSLGVGTAGSGTAGEIRATGNITAYYSDERLKKKLGYIEDALSKVCNIETFYYEANQTAQDLGYKPVREVGVSAQSVQRVAPEIVKPAPIDEQYLTVDYERITPFLIESIKELNKQLAEVQAELKLIKGKI